MKKKDSKTVKKENNTKKKKIFNKATFWGIILSLLIVGASLCLIFALYIIISAPNFDKDLLYTKEPTIVYDKYGVELGRIGTENRDLVTYDDLPQVFVDALIATEDSRFFQHNGVDIARFLKASVLQLIGKDAGGASTITMQLIKNVYTKGQKKESTLESFIRKFQDIYMAVFKVETSYTKEEIMEFYVNTLWLGNDGNINYSGIYGVEQGSQHYFGKSVSELTLAEASLLVGMYQNAYLYNPYKNPVGCRNRQRTVLKLMVNHGYITNEEKDAVLNIPIQSLLAEKKTVVSGNSNQVLIDYVLKEVQEKTKINPYTNPMEIYSTYDPKIQAVLSDVENGKIFKFMNDSDQEGIAITSVTDGSIVAMSGGRNYAAKGFNRAVDISRRPGSTAKPIFDYGPYFEFLNGSTGDMLFDEEYAYSNGTKIKDADGKYLGVITVRRALMSSRNIPALQAFQKVNASDNSIIPNYVHSFGVNYGSQLYESASIGAFNGMSPLQMSAAYAVYARGGYYIEPYAFTKVVFEDGSTFDYKYTKEKVVSAQTSYMITDMLIDTVKNGACGKISIKGTQVAGKTGTTDVDDNFLKSKKIPLGATEDAWDVTYSPEYSIALWYGYDELTKEHYLTSTTGNKARQAIMAGVAKKVYSINKTFKKPGGIVSATIELGTIPLQLASPYTPEDMKSTELFKEGTEPTEVSTRYAQLSNATSGSYSYNNGKVTMTWNQVSLPYIMTEEGMTEYFNNNYGQFAVKYYEDRLTYNSTNIGNLGYDIYSKDASGKETFITWVSSPTYSQTLEAGKTYTFVIKTAYSIFKANESSGLEIKVTTNTPPIDPIIPEENPSSDTPETNN